MQRDHEGRTNRGGKGVRAAIAAGILTALGTTGVAAQECPVDVEDSFDLQVEAINDIYACLEARMAEGYAKGDNAVAGAYRGWAVTGTRAGVAGPHGKRLLLTFANEIAAPEYLKFAEENVTMPVGSVLAKESISISTKKKQARVGPLFIMTKVETDRAPKTGDWVYSGVQPNGKPMKFKQSFCHDCHAAFEDQDFLGYPLEDVRVAQ